MSQIQRESYILAANYKITKLLAKPFPKLDRIAEIRAQRDAVLADYSANGGQRWCGNA